MKFLPRIALTVIVLVLGAACAGDPESAVVRIDVTGCGLAFDGAVAGVVIGPETVVTVAHGVIQGDEFVVDGRSASVTALDVRSDLALLHVPGLRREALTLAAARTGTRARVVGGLSSPSMDVAVVATPTIRIEEVLGTRRIERAGLELDARLDEGDSGAAVVVGDRLVGVVFAVDEARSGAAWAVSSSEIEALLQMSATSWECDGTKSRLQIRQP